MSTIERQIKDALKVRFDALVASGSIASVDYTDREAEEAFGDEAANDEWCLAVIADKSQTEEMVGWLSHTMPVAIIGFLRSATSDEDSAVTATTNAKYDDIEEIIKDAMIMSDTARVIGGLAANTTLAADTKAQTTTEGGSELELMVYYLFEIEYHTTSTSLSKNINS